MEAREFMKRRAGDKASGLFALVTMPAIRGLVGLQHCSLQTALPRSQYKFVSVAKPRSNF
jgi:hypothetical protein